MNRRSLDLVALCVIVVLAAAGPLTTVWAATVTGTLTWSISPSSGGGSCGGVAPPSFAGGLVCDPAMSDEFNGSGAYDTSKWSAWTPGGGALPTQGGGVLTIDSNTTNEFDSVWQLPGNSYYEIRFSFPIGVSGTNTALWFETGLYIGNWPIGNPQCPGNSGWPNYLCVDSTGNPTALEIDFHEGQICGAGAEAFAHIWLPSTPGPPYGTSEQTLNPTYGNGSGCFGGNFTDKSMHTFGLHRWINGGTSQADLYMDGSKYTSLTISPYNTEFGTLPIRNVLALFTAPTTLQVDYIRVYH